MKQLLFLLLFPCLALAQYPGNAGQKITLGEQTTADGLVFRGNAADTVTATLKITKTNKSDTSAFLLLDTINNVFLKYNIGTTYWTRLNILPTDTASMLGNYWRSGRFSGTLPVANGGTGQSTLAANKVMVGNGTSGVLTPPNLHWDNTNSRLGIGTAIPGYKLDVNGTGRFSNTTEIRVNTNDYGNNLFLANGYPNNGIATSISFGHNTQSADPDAIARISGYIDDRTSGNRKGSLRFYTGNGGTLTEQLIIASTGAATFSSSVTATTGIFTNYSGGGTTGASIDNTGQIVRTSSIELKKDITNLKYGLNEILQIKPINFNWKDEDKFGNENENGFIAEDVLSIIPNAVGYDAQGIFMDYNKLIPILTKAIQEQNALIKALEQRLLILENK